MRGLGTESRILRLIEHQATQWELRRRLREEGSKELLKEYPHLAEGPWVTISKSEGAGGLEVARALAGALGWEAFDRELVEAIARKENVRQRVLKSLDERLVGNLQDYFSRLSVRGYPGASVFVRHLMAVISTLGRHGKVVLVGRGAQFLLRPEYGVRVRIHADLDQRAKRFARERRIARDEARRRVRRIDAQRAAWVRRYFHAELDDPGLYDLVINTTRLAPDKAADLVVQVVRARFEG